MEEFSAGASERMEGMEDQIEKLETENLKLRRENKALKAARIVRHDGRFGPGDHDG